MNAVRALTWAIFARHRWIVGASGLYLLALCLIVPQLQDPTRRKNDIAALLVPVLAGLTCLVVSLCYGEESSIDTESGGVPQRLLLLPISSGVIAGVPLLLGLVLFMGLWLAVAFGVLRPCGFDAPVLWPGLLAAVGFVWLAALAWWPMPHPWLRPGLLIVAGFPGLMVWPFVDEVWSPSEPVLLLTLGALWPPGFALAVIGVQRSRSGTVGSWRRPGLAVPTDGVQDPVLPFRSSLSSLLWLEWRMHGRPLLLLSVFCLTIVLPVVILSDHVLRTKPFLFEVIANETVRELGPTWASLTWLLFVPLMYAIAGGGGAGIYSDKPVASGVPVFVAVRPVSNADLLRGKFIAAALHLLMMWSFMLAVTAAWVVIVGQVGEMAERLSQVCGSSTSAALAILAVIASVYVVTYLAYIGSMWCGLFGSNLGAIVPAVLHISALMLGIVLVVNGKVSWLPWIQAGLWVALALKALVVIYLVRLNLKRRLVSPVTIILGLVAWLVLALLFVGAAVWWEEGFSMVDLAVVVLLPLSGILAAPAALHCGRHRSLP